MSDHASDSAHGGHDEHHGVGHVVPVRILVATGLALLVLTWVTVAVAGVDLGEANIYVALAIATLKAALVALFFMHLKHEGRFIRTTFIVTVFTLAVLIAFLFWDVSFR